jgi:hypothetical protein
MFAGAIDICRRTADTVPPLSLITLAASIHAGGQSQERALRWPRSRRRELGLHFILIETCKLNGVDPHNLLHRRAQQAGQSLARLPARGTHAMACAQRSPDKLAA